MTTKDSKPEPIKQACRELESALDQFKSIQVKKKPVDEQQIEKMKQSLEKIKKQLEDFY